MESRRIVVLTGAGISKESGLDTFRDEVRAVTGSEDTPAELTLAFVSERDGNAEIYAIDVNGGTPVRLTNDPARDEQPAWSPDGSRIAFRSTRHGNGEIFAMNADGSGPTNLTNNLAIDSDPAWSPDGTKIAFNRGGNYGDIYVINADGTNETRLTFGAYAEYPAWSPDGKSIAYFSDEGGEYALHVRDSMGTGEETRYLGTYGSTRVSRAVLLSPLPPFLLKTRDNPEGVDRGLFEGFQQAIISDRFAYLTLFPVPGARSGKHID